MDALRGAAAHEACLALTGLATRRRVGRLVPFSRPVAARTRATNAATASRRLSTDSAPQKDAGHRSPHKLDDTKGFEWENSDLSSVQDFQHLPDANFGLNQHMPLGDEVKNVLKSIVWQFRAPIRYAFAYGSGVFPQAWPADRVRTDENVGKLHVQAPAAIQRAQDGTPKMVDFMFVVTHTQHFHSLNMRFNRHHYSGLASLGSGAVALVQDKWGAGVYFNPYVVVNGVLTKYGVVSMATIEKDLTEWDTLYLAGRLHKPVKILRDDPRIRIANQANLLAALRTALLLLPSGFDELDLYSTIAGISYLGDPRMSLPAENKSKVQNIVGNNLVHFRRLYHPLIETLPNMAYNGPDDWMRDERTVLGLQQDMDPVRRGNMVRRLPKQFRSRLYFEYQKKLAIPQPDFDTMVAESEADDVGSFKRREGGGFERRIVQDDPAELRTYLRAVIKKTVQWPSMTQSLKSVLTAGVARSWRYMGEKMAKWRQGRHKTSRVAGPLGSTAKTAEADKTSQ